MTARFDQTLAIAGLEALASKAGDNPRALAMLARWLATHGQFDRAGNLAARAMDLAPDDPEIRGLVADAISRQVPDWHFVIVRDEARNAAFEAALTRAIRPGERVLEIGTGTGLLAMMAARAGATVVTCEMNAAIAEVAAKIIARNGLADRVRVVAGKSTDLSAETDLSGRTDLLVTEILGNDLIGEGVLPAMEHAVKHLLRPGAQVIPARGAIRVALAEDRELARFRIGEIAGFDLSPFNRLAPACYPIRVGQARLVLRSPPADLFSFDFQSGGPFPEDRQQISLVADGGVANGIVQWLTLQLDEAVGYENAPSIGATSCWAAMFHPLARPIEPAAGQPIAVFGSHDRSQLQIWTDVT